MDGFGCAARTSAMRARSILYATAFVRALATGMVALVLAVYLTRLDLTADAIGIVVGAGLAGNTAALGLASWLGPRVGAKRLLAHLALASSVGALVVAHSSSVAVMGVAAFLGMLNGMGRDRGAGLALEQALLPATVSAEQRTRAFAWYNALQDAGHALGALLAGAPALLRHGGTVAGDRVLLWIYAALCVLCVLLYTRLQTPHAQPRVHSVHLTPASRRVLARVAALFALDSLGGGFLTTALVSYFFFKRFGVGEGTVAALFFAARVANALSHFAAAGLARRIGLVKTMVLTHLPSSALLVTVAFAPNFLVAAVLFLVRESLVEMDVPTRQSYVMAIVQPEERTLVSSVTNLVRMIGWTLAPFVGGALMQRVSLAVPLFIGASLKIAYDALLYLAFRRLPAPEELRAGSPTDRRTA
jgi:MFS family permease